MYKAMKDIVGCDCWPCFEKKFAIETSWRQRKLCLNSDTFPSIKKTVDKLIKCLHTSNSLLLIVTFNSMKCFQGIYCYWTHAKPKSSQSHLIRVSSLSRKTWKIKYIIWKDVFSRVLVWQTSWLMDMDCSDRGNLWQSIGKFSPKRNSGSLIIFCIRSVACRNRHSQWKKEDRS